MKRLSKSIDNMWRSFKEVFKHPLYIFITILFISGIIFLAVWLPNLHFLKTMIISSSYSLLAKWSILWNSFGALRTNFTLSSSIFVVLTAILSGINISMVIYYIRRRKAELKATGTSLIGLIFGLLGVGCAACGSVILSSIFGLAATAGFISYLPLRGQEFGLLSVFLLFVSLYIITKKINEPVLCQVKNRGD